MCNPVVDGFVRPIHLSHLMCRSHADTSPGNSEQPEEVSSSQSVVACVLGSVENGIGIVRKPLRHAVISFLECLPERA